MATGPYLKEVRKFLRSADWLTDEHAPMVVHLKTLAGVLDQQLEEGKVEERTAALFGTTWHRLKKPVQKNVAAKDDESEDGLSFS